VTVPEPGAAGPEYRTVGEALLARADDDDVGLLFEDSAWTWGEVVRESEDWADWLLARRTAPFHVGVLLDNVPEFAFLLGAAALSGAVLVGLNPTRSASELREDVARADCGLIVTEPRYAASLLAGGAEGLPPVHVVGVDDPPPAGRRDPAAWAAAAPAPDQLLLLIFTSGTSGRPKAVRCSNGPIVTRGGRVARIAELGRADVAYEAMPLFHSAAIIGGWAPMLITGGTLALRRRFSATQFLPDVRRFGATYVNYVGKPLAYVLAQPPRADDADNPIRVAFGNEASGHHVREFSRRFNCRVMDLYGSTEGGVNIARDEDTPPAALGRVGEQVRVLSPATGLPCPPAEIRDGVVLNLEEAVGELVNVAGAGAFEGYYGDEDSTEDRLRDGKYWTGDLAYADREGFLYFVGRSSEWLRVDGENLGVAPVEAVLSEHPDVVAVAVYGVPDEIVGDQVMAALVLRDSAVFEGAAFSEWLRAQPGYARKSAPRLIRIARALPQTETNKVLRRHLIQDGWWSGDPVWWRDGNDPTYRSFTPDDAAELDRRFAESGRPSPAAALAGSRSST
jgi:fatty-acyl-CoA synthase